MNASAPTPLTLRAEGAVAVVEIDNPPANALDWILYGALEDLLPRLAADDGVRAVVFAGADPKIFVAGADLKKLGAGALTPVDVETRIVRAQRVFAALEALPKPTVAAIGGHAMGGGCELALALDFRVMERGRARIGLPEASLGLMPSAGGTQRLPRLVGRDRAARMMMLAERLDADEAERIGLVSRAVDAPVGEEALALARDLSEMPASSLRGIKSALAAATDLDGGLTAERAAAELVFAHPDAAEGVAAFLEKRPGRFHNDH